MWGGGGGKMTHPTVSVQWSLHSTKVDNMHDSVVAMLRINDAVNLYFQPVSFTLKDHERFSFFLMNNK